ncbi:MAG: hypothetical protein ACD_5C00063G0001, partial [uncultured bacterium]
MNRIYNPVIAQMEVVIASPAEVLNLVCAATIDCERYLESGETTSRIESFGNYLLRLQQEEKKMQRNYCTGGVQHGLLELLQNAYLDRPRHARGKPMRFLANLGTFLLSALSQFAKDQLTLLEERERFALLIDWLQWSLSKESTGLSPLILTLRRLHQEEDSDICWQRACREYLISECHFFGLDHQAKDEKNMGIEEYLEIVQDLSPDNCTEDQTILHLKEILTVPEKLILDFQLPDVGSLLLKFNAALRRFKTMLTPQTEREAILHFYRAHQARALYTTDAEFYFPITAVPVSLLEARAVLRDILSAYYEDYTLAKRLPAEVDAITESYHASLKAFSDPEMTLVLQAMRILQYPTTGNNREQVEKKEKLLAANSKLSDEQLTVWHKMYQYYLSEGYNDICGALVSRFLLHALFVSPTEWTENYRALLAELFHVLVYHDVEDLSPVREKIGSLPNLFIGNLYLLLFFS